MQIELSKFPTYLGYGKLKPESYRLSDGKASVEYEYADMPIMRVEQSENSACVDEFYADKPIGISYGANLQKAITLHYLSLDQFASPLHRAWVSDLISQGNIYAEYISKTKHRMLFYPAVYLMETLVPVLEERIKEVNEYLGRPEIRKWQPRMDSSTLITVYPDRTENLPIKLLKIITPIAHTIGVAKSLSQAGIINSEKRFRAIVSVARPASGVLVRSFKGTDKDVWLSYSITVNNEL